MREKLEKIEGTRGRFSGTIARCGHKSGWKGADIPTILLTNVRDASGRIVCDHLWFNMTKGFAGAGVGDNIGAMVKFDARVKAYIKGYAGRREDFDFPPSHPTNIELATNSLRSATDCKE